MHWYAIGPTLTPLERAPAAETPGALWKALTKATRYTIK